MNVFVITSSAKPDKPSRSSGRGNTSTDKSAVADKSQPLQQPAAFKLLRVKALLEEFSIQQWLLDKHESASAISESRSLSGWGGWADYEAVYGGVDGRWD